MNAINDPMTREEYLADMWGFYSDVHKDAYGFRPRGEGTYQWFIALSKDEMTAEFAQLQERINENEEHNRKMEAQCAEAVEGHIKMLIASGAGDRATALRWMHDANNTNGDWEYLAYVLGVAYGYFKKDAE